jgi:twitching motility protein PilT
MVHIDDLLQAVVERQAHDLHLRVGEPPLLRVQGRLERVAGAAVITDSDMDGMVRAMLNDEQEAHFTQNMELDLSYATDELGRFRVNVFRQHGHLGVVMHVVPTRIRTLEELQVPPVVMDVCRLPRGLILVTGPTGCGKSTTLAAMIDYINNTRSKHIITIEDPIEFIHHDNLSIIEQREVGTDTHSFSAALKHVMRQNPDVILVGEMRDLETIQLAITAAETGHLVLGTLHTIDAAKTVDRIIDVFEPDQQQQIRLQVSITLQAVLSQALLRRSDTYGQVAAFEVMVVTPAIRNLIRENKTFQLPLEIGTGGMYGMQTLDSHVLSLLLEGHIDYDQAVAVSTDPDEFDMRYRRAIERQKAAAEAAHPGGPSTAAAA